MILATGTSINKDKAPGKPALEQIFQKGRTVKMDPTTDTSMAIKTITKIPIPATEGPTIVDSM